MMLSLEDMMGKKRWMNSMDVLAEAAAIATDEILEKEKLIVGEEEKVENQNPLGLPMNEYEAGSLMIRDKSGTPEKTTDDHHLLDTETVLWKFIMFHVEESKRKAMKMMMREESSEKKSARFTFSDVHVPKKKRSLRPQKLIFKKKPSTGVGVGAVTQLQRIKRSVPKKKNVIKTKVQLDSNHPPPPDFDDMPAEFKNRINNMGGSNVKLVIQKQLFKTDVTKTQGRLSIPLNQIRADFLTDEEKNMLNREGGEIEVSVIEPSLDDSILCLRKWCMNKCDTYVLVKHWNKIVHKDENGLKEGVTVQLWSFRVDSELRFALVKVGMHGGQQTGSCRRGNSSQGGDIASSSSTPTQLQD